MNIAGDGSLKKDCTLYKELCQYRLNLLIKISFNPYFESYLIQRFKSYIPKTFVCHNSIIFGFRENFKAAITPKKIVQKAHLYIHFKFLVSTAGAVGLFAPSVYYCSY